jgi:hypothetical protein
MSDPTPDTYPKPRRSRLFLGILVVLLVGGGGALLVLYKQIWDVDRPTAPVPGRATGLTKADPNDPGAAKPAETESEKTQEALGHFFSGLKTSLAYARDGMRSRFAVENLKSLSEQVDGVIESVGKLPAADKAKAVAFAREQLGPVKEEAEKTLAERSVGGRLKPIVEPMLAKLDALTK